MVFLKNKYIYGIFKKELKNRFLCEVNIDGEDTICYVPSSCHLSNFLELKNKKVILVPTSTPNSRTKFSLFAVPYKKNYIILNTSMANMAIEDNISSRRFSFLGKRKKIINEYVVDGYKADLYLPESNTVVEIKSVISTKSTACFPTVYSERTIKQLNQIYELLQKGYKASLIIVSLHPYIKKIKIDRESEFFKKLKLCMDEGLVLKSYSCRLKENKILIDKEILIEV